MSRDQRPAVVTIRMSHALRDTLNDRAAAAGCSLNSFALQVLSAAAGDAGRFRAAPSLRPVADDRSELRALNRRPDGNPEGMRERNRHLSARAAFIEVAMKSLRGRHWDLMGKIDRECPWHYVEWNEFNAPLVPAGPEFEDLLAAG